METSPYHLDYDDNFFKFTASRFWFEKDRTLLIERQTCRVKQSQGQLVNLPRSKKMNVQLIIGTIVIRDEPFLSVVTSAQQVALIVRQPVYQIKQVVFIAFRKGFNQKKFNYLQTVKDLDGVRDNIINDNFYFCYGYNLTLSLQKKSEGITMEQMFFWNQSMLSEFRGYGINNCWMIPVVQGFVKGFRAETLYIPYEYTLIARRSKYQSGTRFVSRGINAEGHVANFVQTEEIYCFHRLVISWVTLRGSVPLFWGQAGFGSKVKIAQSNNQKNILQKHLKMLQKLYSGRLVVVDLLSDREGTNVSEHELQRKFSSLYEQMCGETYINLDLNEYVNKHQNDVQTAIDKWVTKNADSLCGDFFAFQHFEGNVLSRQTRYLRVNCLDCLDRTNVIQFKTSEKMIALFQQYINELAEVEQKKVSFSEDFRDKHRELWTQMGDRISMIYSGTTSVSSYITKGEKSKNFFSTLGSGFKSLNRYYNANVNDTYKQQCIDWMLRSSQDTKIHYFQDKASVKLNQVEYCEFQQINLTVISWNCAQVSPTEMDLGLLLEMPSLPDVLIICLQEVVELNTYNVLLGGTKYNQNRWKQSLERLMQIHNKNMVFMGQQDLVGVLTLMFVAQRHLDAVNNVIWSSIKTGFKGNLGNKGAVLLSFKFNDSIITVTNCHLEAGEGKLSQRLYSVQYIHNNCFASKNQHRQYQNSDFKFLVGDLNFRIDIDAEQAKELLYQVQKQRKSDPNIDLHKHLESLLALDELLNARAKHQILGEFLEAPITFLPTYKYGKRSNQYDYKRTPSWCDRILYYSANPLKLMLQKYNRKDNVNYSDHKPVYGIFHLFVRKQDHAKKKMLYEEFMKW